MAGDATPTIRRRRLGHELRRLREAAGITADQIAEELECSRPKISRIENGHVGVRLAELRTMLDFYGVTDDTLRDTLIKLSRDARQRGWWADAVEDTVSMYVGLELAASTVSVYMAQAIPGLLQVPSYARALLSCYRPAAPGSDIEQWVTVRVNRQRRLTSEDPLELAAVIDEAALRRQVGGHATMIEQIRHLAAAAALPRTKIQVLPLSTGEHSALTGSFSLLDFPDAAEPTVVYIEYLTGNLYLEKPEEIASFRSVFAELQRVAMSPADSARFLETMQNEIATV